MGVLPERPPLFATTVLVVLSWYATNIGVLLLNKFLLSSTGFKQPVFLTMCHMVACASLGYALSAAGVTPIKPLKSRRQLWKVCLLSTIFCITIVLGNLSLKYLPVSFNQAVGSTTPFFTAVFALLMQGAREGTATYLTLIPIAGGVVIASGGEPLFHAFGFAACLLATSGRALKSVVQAMLLTDATERLDPMSLLFYMSSFSVLLLLPTATLLEPGAFAQAAAMGRADGGFLLALLVNSVTAYGVNLTNFMVTKYTSALTLQVLGNMKGVIAAGISIALFRNPVTLKGMLGYAVTVAGVVAYSETKRRAKLRQLQNLHLSDAGGVSAGGGLVASPRLGTKSSGQDLASMPLLSGKQGHGHGGNGAGVVVHDGGAVGVHVVSGKGSPLLPITVVASAVVGGASTAARARPTIAGPDS